MGDLATINDVEAFLGRPLTGPEQHTAAGLLAAADATIRAFVGRHITEVTYAGVEVWVSSGVLVLPDWPVTSLAITRAGRPLDAGEYLVGERGVVRARRGYSAALFDWPSMPLTVTATVGHATAPSWATIPAVLMAVAGLSDPSITAGAAGPVVAEKVIDHAVEYGTGSGSVLGGVAAHGLPAAAVSILWPHRRGDVEPPTFGFVAQPAGVS